MLFLFLLSLLLLLFIFIIIPTNSAVTVPIWFMWLKTKT